MVDLADRSRRTELPHLPGQAVRLHQETVHAAKGHSHQHGLQQPAPHPLVGKDVVAQKQDHRRRPLPDAANQVGVGRSEEGVPPLAYQQIGFPGGDSPGSDGPTQGRERAQEPRGGHPPGAGAPVQLGASGKQQPRIELPERVDAHPVAPLQLAVKGCGVLGDSPAQGMGRTQKGDPHPGRETRGLELVSSGSATRTSRTE